MSTDVSANAIQMPAADVAQERAASNSGEFRLSTGVRAKIKPVSASLIQEVVSRVKYPDVPMWYNPDRERDEPNPADPAYIRAVEQVNQDRGIAAMDAAIMFGIQLLEPVPVDGDPAYDGWIEMLDMMGITFDRTNKFRTEFAYKKYIACSQNDIANVMKLSGITPDEVETATETFRGNA